MVILANIYLMIATLSDQDDKLGGMVSGSQPTDVGAEWSLDKLWLSEEWYIVWWEDVGLLQAGGVSGW